MVCGSLSGITGFTSSASMMVKPAGTPMAASCSCREVFIIICGVCTSFLFQRLNITISWFFTVFPSECFRSQGNIDVFRESLDQLPCFAERGSTFEYKMLSHGQRKKRFRTRVTHQSFSTAFRLIPVRALTCSIICRRWFSGN